MTKISVLIRTKNEAETIQTTLEKVFSQSVTDREVLVIDSGSADGTLEIVRRHPVRCFEIPFEAFTYGYALNYGFERAEGLYVACLSAHALPISDKWLETLLAVIEEEGTAGVMGRNLPYPHCNPFDQRELLRIERTQPQELTEKTSFTFSNANCMIRKEVWGKIPFNEQLPYAEDIDWARRVRILGYRIKYEPSATVYHSHNGTLRQVGREFYLWAMAEAEMKTKGTQGQGIMGLIGKGIRGTIVDWFHILKNGFSPKWFLIAPIRRAIIFLTRFKGSRRIPLSTGLLQVLLERPFVLVFKRLNEFLSASSGRIASWIRRSPYPIHPKHLIRENGSSYWFEKDIKGKKTVLDVGSDLGNQTFAVGRNVSLAIGFDIRKERIALANQYKRKKGVTNVFFYVGNAEANWPFRAKTFDALLMSDVLEHVEDERKVLEEGYRVLKPDGMLLLVLPNGETSWKRKQASLGICPFSDRDHKREYQEKDLPVLLKRYQFELVDLQKVVIDTPWAGLLDFLGALNLPFYKWCAQWKQQQVKLNPEETTGFRIIAKKVLS